MTTLQIPSIEATTAAAVPSHDAMPVASRIAAVVGHADDSDLLKRWIGHHLSIGISHIFVSANDDDPETDGVLDAYRADPRIRSARVQRFATDASDHLSNAARVVMDWCKPDWMLFCDSDEFYIPATGWLSDVAGLLDQDVLLIERYNTPPLTERDGTIRAPDFTDPAQLLMIAARQEVDTQYLAGHADVPWIMARDAPKLLVRADVIRRVGAGGQTVHAQRAAIRSAVAQDVVILHAPFTTERRFRHKLRSIPEFLSQYGARFHPREAWLWRYWLALPEDQIGAEFRRQTIKTSAVPTLIAQGVLTTPAAHLLPEQQQARAASPRPELVEALGRVVVHEQPASAEAPQEIADTAIRHPMPEPTGSLLAAPVRRVERVEDCYFYHTMDIPELGLVGGRWDLRGVEQTYLGSVPLAGRSVFEIGTASGHLAFWMERQGASVTAFDVDDHHDWDLVPFSGLDLEEERRNRKSIIRLINNSWWFAREKLRSSARCVYGTVYELGGITEKFDIVVLSSLLLHLRDPFLALQLATALSRDTVVVTEVDEQGYVASDPPVDRSRRLRFVPRADRRAPIDGWWFVPPQTTVEFLNILGFASTQVTRHKQRFMSGEDWDFYTVVGRRGAGEDRPG